MVYSGAAFTAYSVVLTRHGLPRITCHVPAMPTSDLARMVSKRSATRIGSEWIGLDKTGNDRIRFDRIR